MKSRIITRTIIIAIVVLAFAWSGFSYWMASMGAPGPLAQPVTLILPKGANTHQIADLLVQNGVIDHPLEFRIAARARFDDQNMKAGEYEFTPHMSMQQVFLKITGGDVLNRTVTIPEGKTVAQVRSLLLNTEGLEGPPLEFQEGALLPETYTFHYGTKRADLMRDMAKAMTQAVNEAWAARAPDLPLQTPHDLLVLASMIEKETGKAEERPLIASVFVNRLRQGMRLESDPTVMYDLGTEGPLTREQLHADTPDNTYVHAGLPPSPICNPGKAAIEAAAHPAATDYLYFVADGTGGHVFASSYAEHQKNVANYIKVLRRQAQQAKAHTEAAK